MASRIDNFSSFKAISLTDIQGHEVVVHAHFEYPSASEIKVPDYRLRLLKYPTLKAITDLGTRAPDRARSEVLVMFSHDQALWYGTTYRVLDEPKAIKELFYKAGLETSLPAKIDEQKPFDAIVDHLLMTVWRQKFTPSKSIGPMPS